MTIGFIMAIIFTVLKLVDKVDWSWWWVLSPLWIELGLVMFIVTIFIILKRVLR